MARFSPKENNIFLIIAISLSRILLDYTYITDVSPRYEYRGLTYSFDMSRMIMSWIVLCIFIVLSLRITKNDNREEQKGAVILNILLCASAVPTTTIIAYFDSGVLFSILVSLYWIILVFAYEMHYFEQKFSFVEERMDALFYCITAVFVLNIAVIIAVYTGVDVNLNLSDVYEARTIFKQNQIPTALRYLFFGSTMVFPIIVVYALKTKKAILAVIASACQILAFFADGRKSTLFMLILTIVGFCFIKNFNIRLIPVGSLGIILLGCMEKCFFHSNTIINFVVRRLYLLPAYLHYAYYDFFSSHPKDFLRQSIAGRMGMSSPYSKMIPEVVGADYYGGSYANNGLFSDAFANFGIVGVIVYPILLAFALKWLDQSSRNISIGVSMGVIFSMSYALLSSFFFTVMLTHGFIICCVVVALMPAIYSKGRNLRNG